MNPPIYYRDTQFSARPTGSLLTRWRWEIRDGGAEGPPLAAGTTLTQWGAYRQRERARARCKRKPVIKHRMAPTRAFTDADRDAALTLINRLMPTFAAGMRAADDLTLQHEAERLEAEPTSPVVRSMRQIVDGERAARAGAVAPC